MLEELFRYKNIILVAAVIAVCSLFALHSYRGYSKEKVAFRDEIAELEKKRATVNEILEMQKQVRKFESRLLEGDAFSLKRLVEELALAEGVEIQKYAPGAIEEAEDYVEVNITLSINASYRNLMGFIARLEETGAIEIIDLTKARAAGRRNQGDGITLRGLMQK